MSQTVGFAVSGGILSGMLFLSAAFGSPGALVTTSLTPLPLFLVGLSLGAPACVLAGIVSSLGVMLVLGAAEMMALFAAGTAIPIALLVHQAVTVRPDSDGVPQWPPAGNLVLWLVGFAATGVLAAAIVTATRGAGLELEILAIMTQQLPMLDTVTGGDGSRVVELVTRYGPAMMAGGWMLMAITNAALAQWLVHRFDLAVRPPIGMADVELPLWPLAALATLVALAVLAKGQVGYAALNLGLVLSAAFVFAGLGVVHALVRSRPARPLMLVVFYSAAVWLGVASLGAMALLGIIERWAGIRRRVAATGPDLEDK